MKLDRGAGADSSDDASIQPAIGGRNSACSSRYGPLIERGLLA